MWKKTFNIRTGLAIHEKDGNTVLISDGPGRMWHLSISREDRYPVWDEIKEARYALIPNEITMCMILPPKEEYVNLHRNTFHLHEIRDGKVMR